MRLIFLLLFYVLWVPTAGAVECAEEKVNCYTGVFRRCKTTAESDPCVVTGYVECVNRKCDDKDRGCPVDPVGPVVQPRLRLGDSCDLQKNFIEATFKRAVSRLEDCFRFASVRQDVVQKMRKAIAEQDGAYIECRPLQNSRFCAAGGGGTIILPPKYFAGDPICSGNSEAILIHEIAHNAHLVVSGGHNETGESSPGVDEIYALERYCMTPARTWLERSKHTSDVVRPDQLDCMRRYQERTPETLDDPFWKPIQAAVKAGRNPC